VFPSIGECYLIADAGGRQVRRPADFKALFPVSIGFVPVLGPVEHKEQLYIKETARRALLSHGASRNFRNIWHHYLEGFDEFKDLIASTWPGMEIEQPKVVHGAKQPVLLMYCSEERFPREIYWAGFGFQVWCQILTYMVKAIHDTIFIVDEPDIYLHPDLQRQLMGLLRELGPDILVATHSTEIITIVDHEDILIVDKRGKSARRITESGRLQSVFDALGSSLNPTITQLAKHRRVIYVEGGDFTVIAAFARVLAKRRVHARSAFSVIQVQGFNPQKVKNITLGIESTLGAKVLTLVIFDRDYRSVIEVDKIRTDLEQACDVVHIHHRKEIENYLLEALPLDRAIHRRISDRAGQGHTCSEFDDDLQILLMNLTADMKNDVQGQVMAKREPTEQRQNPGHDLATIKTRLLSEFDQQWASFETRMAIVPGKEVLARLNGYLQEEYGISLTVQGIVGAFHKSEVPDEIVTLIDRIDTFTSTTPLLGSPKN
jgi:hypothetical protein